MNNQNRNPNPQNQSQQRPLPDPNNMKKFFDDFAALHMHTQPESCGSMEMPVIRPLPELA